MSVPTIAKGRKVAASTAKPRDMIRRDPNFSARGAVNGDTTIDASASGMVARPASSAL